MANISNARALLCDLFDCLIPGECAACARTLLRQEKVICLHCRQQLCPGTSIKEAILADKFYYPLVAVHTLSNYHQNSILQLLIHKIKYDFRPDVARELGAILGSSFPEPNTGSLVPVPQTGYKTHKRGYNQSEIIARGISSIWRMPIHRNLLIRTRHKYSQTKMNRLERYENLRSSLLLNNIKRAEEPVWLIDDVVTTGATLNACLEVLFNAGYNQVGIVILANA